MAKEFKNWDKHFTKAQIEETRKVWERTWLRRNKEINDILQSEPSYPFFWVHHSHFRTDYTREQIADAVYTSDGAVEWQRFRVALKGLPTEQKLAYLETRWDIYVKDNIMGTRGVEMIRINNYIGALKRGGQLDDKFDVRK